MSADACTRSIHAEFSWKSCSGDLIHSFTSENVDLALWKLSKGTSCPKCPRRTGACDVSCRYSRTAVVRVFFFSAAIQISRRVAHQQGKEEQQGGNNSLGHLVCLSEVSLGKIKQPLKKLLVWVKRRRETQWVFLLHSNKGNSSMICIILGKREQSRRVWFLPGVIKLFIMQLGWSTWAASVKLCLCTSLDHSQSDCVLQNWDTSELQLRMKWRGPPCHLVLGQL